jgi:3-hydroxyisobutyrate dehydrogenase-like beta-hydroxyacid dehydrogenase
MMPPDSHPADEPIGVIGTGQLGSVFCQRLLVAGHRVFVYDVDATALERLDPRVERCDSAAAVAAVVPVVITCVTSPDAVLDCVLGEDGVLSSAGAGALVIDTTTSTPTVTRHVGEQLKAIGAVMVDAPVSRGVYAAERGALSVWLGGDKADVELAQFYLKPLATDFLHVGPLGCGHAVKAVNMMLMGVNLIATAEVLAIAHASGISSETMLAVLNASSGATYLSQNHFPNYVLTGSYDSKFTLDLMQKDLRIARDLAEAAGVPALFLQRALATYQLCLATNRAEGDNMCIVPFIWKLMAGTFEHTAPDHEK